MIVRSPAVAGATLAALTLPAPASASAAASPSRAPLSASAAAVLHLVNAERRSRGLRALRPSRRLSRAASRHARAMVVRRFFAHVAPDGSTPLDRIRAAGLHPHIAGENLGWGEGGRARPSAIVRAWLRSPGHRRVLLDRRLRLSGVAVAAGTPRGRRDGLTYVQTFAAH